MTKLFATDAEFDAAMAITEGKDIVASPVMPANSPEPPVTASAAIIPFEPDWPVPSSRFMGQELPPAPALPLEEILPPKLAAALRLAARSKSAPVDFVFAGMLSVAASLIGNTRWAQVQPGWKLPTAIWTMLIGNPSAGKSPALDAVLSPLREIEKEKRKSMRAEIEEYNKQAQIAALAESAWQSQVKKSFKEGEATPEQPTEMDLPPQPFPPCYIINDATVEKMAVILSEQPRGVLQSRDELAGFIENMERYSSSDRQFFLEAYGGRSFAVERMGRPSLIVDRLLISVTGGIQPDKFNSLLLDTVNDGLLPRFLPIWPELAPIEGPIPGYDDSFLQGVMEKLSGLEMKETPDGEVSPWLVYFTDDAALAALKFRKKLRVREGGVEGLMLPFLGKMGGLSACLSLILAFLDWASGAAEEPTQITVEHYSRATLLIEDYILPMAWRCYGLASASKDERTARALVAIIRENGWKQFSTVEVLRLGKKGLDTALALNPILARLEDADVIKRIEPEVGAKGRPKRMYAVNPKIH